VGVASALPLALAVREVAAGEDAAVETEGLAFPGAVSDTYSPSTRRLFAEPSRDFHPNLRDN
jgi:hypothetical protein